MTAVELDLSPNNILNLCVTDRASASIGMALCGVIFGLAIVVNQGQYSPLALVLLTIGAVPCIGAVALHLREQDEHALQQRFTKILGAIVSASTIIFTGILLYLYHQEYAFCVGILFFAALGFLQLFDLRAWRIPLLLTLVLAFSVLCAITFISPRFEQDPGIDVLIFQQDASAALRHGHNPYALRFPNIYESDNSTSFENPDRSGPGTPFYGPGVVDDNGWINYGFPYPPLSLLMVLPAYLLGGDCRFAQTIAIALSALLMATARPGKIGSMVAVLFLVNTQVFYVVDMSWTEPLLVFNFSLVMFCACRWRKGLPWVLGLFFATKQYTVLALPAIFLLMDSAQPLKQLLKTFVKAGAVVGGITLPFVLWNPHAFIRAVVQWQFVQPFRADALSYLAWIYNLTGGHKAPMWTPFLIVVPVIVMALARSARNPSGFAAAVTVICFTFFAFNKQAFCNYYFFVIAAAFWCVAAAKLESRMGG